MSDKLDIEEIKAACEAATPGPWEQCYFAQNGHVCTFAPAGGSLAPFHLRGGNKRPATAHFTDAQVEANARFVAGSRSWVPALVAEVERLENVIAATNTAYDAVVAERDRLRDRKMVLCQEIVRLRGEIRAQRNLSAVDAFIPSPDEEAAR